ncbi:hypothetical protein ACFE04_019470 [Oxalis oulophora]
MSNDPIVVMWSLFLGFCKVYGEIELGREAANILFKLDPDNAAAYVAIVHIYTKAGLWDEVEGIRKLMKQREHYKYLKAKSFFPKLIEYITSGPAWEVVGVVASARKLIGATNPLQAEPGTIRGDLACC